MKNTWTFNSKKVQISSEDGLTTIKIYQTDKETLVIYSEGGRNSISFEPPEEDT